MHYTAPGLKDVAHKLKTNLRFKFSIQFLLGLHDGRRLYPIKLLVHSQKTKSSFLAATNLYTVDRERQEEKVITWFVPAAVCWDQV